MAVVDKQLASLSVDGAGRGLFVGAYSGFGRNVLICRPVDLLIGRELG